ncbi:MAG: hypothetical protein JJW00_02040 [Sulfurimonas sp.]|nr:hypothetical protein [Sulfurimonas sp.]
MGRELAREWVRASLDKLYIDARYPGNFGLLPYGKPTLGDAIIFHDIAKDIFKYANSAILINN